MYKPAIRTDPAAILREPFSTTVGIPICNAKTSNFEGTGGLFFIDSTNPGILYLLTARHVLFHPDKEENKLYKFHEGSGAARRKVMLMGDAAFKARCDSLESIIRLSRMKIEQINRELEATEKLEDEDDVIAEREEAEKVITAFKELLATVTMDWEDKEKRVIGHVTLSPPLTFNHGADGFTDDWAVIEIHPSMISKFNFIGNAIDLGYVGYDELMVWMYPHPANPSSFNYPHDRLLRFFGTVSDQEMFKLDPKTKDKDTDPVTMVLKNGATSNLTVGRLNTIRAFTREYSKNKPGEMSKEVGVLPRNSRSGPFSKPGDSGSVVVDGKGRVCGILTGRDGVTEDSDCIFVTSINFIIKRLADFGIKANIFPLPADL
ncbi:hypothetical protein E1B28_013663 [Marasmius oreades]|nr:uncharacterized protein E1B28_013663 [Marasmius oreades]KAG7087717.1 hypothetical protein E1B28_013663 [Marasmius oreades]